MKNINKNPLVVEYLQTHSLGQLKAEYGVKTSAKVRDRYFSVNYDQIESKPGPLVNECRGLVLSLVEEVTEEHLSGTKPFKNITVEALPFERFFNLGDPNATKIDLEDKETVYYTKLDGTCSILYYNSVEDSWEVATRSVPLADKPITGWEDMTFRKLFEKALTDTLFSQGMILKDSSPSLVFKNFTNNLHKGYTYMFELTTPLNRIVVEYKDFRIWLLGVRNTGDGSELHLSTWKAPEGLYGVPVCPSHKLSNLSELLEFVSSKSPTEQEGIVVCDKNFNRIKVKSLAYLAYAKVKDSTSSSPRGVMELILSERLDDMLSILEPFVQDQAMKMQEGLRKLVHETDLGFQDILSSSQGTSNPRKAFALEVQARKAWMAPLIDRFLGNNSGLVDWIQKQKNPENGTWPDSFLDNLIDKSN